MRKTSPQDQNVYGLSLWVLCDHCYTVVDRALEALLARTPNRAGQGELPLFVEVAPAAKPTRPDLDVINVLGAVCRHLNVSPHLITSPQRTRTLNYARQLAMYLLREDAGLSYSAIAQLLNRKDHSTIIHHCDQVTEQLEYLPALRSDVAAVRALARSRGGEAEAEGKQQEGAASA